MPSTPEPTEEAIDFLIDWCIAPVSVPSLLGSAIGRAPSEGAAKVIADTLRRWKAKNKDLIDNVGCEASKRFLEQFK